MDVSQNEIKRQNSQNSILSSNQARIFALEQKKAEEEDVIYRDISFKEIM